MGVKAPSGAKGGVRRGRQPQASKPLEPAPQQEAPPAISAAQAAMRHHTSQKEQSESPQVWATGFFALLADGYVEACLMVCVMLELRQHSQFNTAMTGLIAVRSQSI